MSIQAIASITPEWLKPVLRPLYSQAMKTKARATARLRQKSREEIHAYWREPWDGVNLPEGYAHCGERSVFLVNLLREYVSTEASILEAGCNVGRNLQYLYLDGFRHLAGIEISENAVNLMHQVFPEMAECAHIINAPAEEALGQLGDNAYHVVFTMAVLQHIHPRSTFVFGEMARVVRRHLVTIEAEVGYSWRSFPRNYQHIFEGLGLQQVSEQSCSDVPGLGEGYVARVFHKAHLVSEVAA